MQEKGEPLRNPKVREFRLWTMRDIDRARRVAETDDERQHRLSTMRERERDRIRKGSETLLRERMTHTRRDSETDGERQQRLSRIRDNSRARRDSEIDSLFI